MLDLESKDGGDKLLGNGASIPVEMTGSQYIKDEPEKETPPDESNPDTDPDEGEELDENNDDGGERDG